MTSQAPGKCPGATLSLRRFSHSPGDAPVFHRNQPAGTAQMLRRYAVANALSAFTRYLPPANWTSVPRQCDRRRRCLFEFSQLARTSMSRKPPTTLGCPPIPRSGTCRWGRERRRERDGHGSPASGRRFERRQGWRSEIKRAAPSGVSSCGEARSAFQLPERSPGACDRRRAQMRVDVDLWRIPIILLLKCLAPAAKTVYLGAVGDGVR